MISLNNFRQVLQTLGFVQEGQVFEKRFAQTDTLLKVDFDKQEMIYPEDKGLIINERQTCNFSQSENFVVFECVHRLLEKGYLPKHIELEPKWKVGRGASGGRADILVKNQENKPLLLIECKTAGKEFEKAWKDTQQDGGQLFSYAQQIQETEFLCLYASDFDEKTNQIIISQHIISHKDNKDVLEQDKNLKSFEKAKDVKERYEVWKNTYKLESTESGIFEESIQAYQIGKNKYTLEEDTKPLSSIDKKGLYHEFRTILRKHNVSRRENAFDVLVNLFLCKIVDETENKTDLKFRWKGIAYDNYYDLVDRLQGLYQSGMKKFLKEDILYVSNEEIDKAFWTTRTNRNATKKRIKEIFRELKFYKGLDFEFIKVHNAKGFDKNAKILIDIIKMWQNVRLTSQTQNQFLGDMFEFFLDNGIKQTEGQFFTPIPICKFIIASLPLEQKIREKSEPLKVIDYACGAGHFLTEYATAVTPIIRKYKDENAIKQHYANIFGIEKEDRLAKVATVSACMYGQNEINIIDTDALASHEILKKETFDVLVANPPFAVDDFLEVLLQNDEKEAKTYELFQNANIGTNNIQCFFLERAKHLLNRNGAAGIIVPTSVLSNSDTMHIQTREILLKYFDFVSIVELGSGTFSKTGTNTVVLFLKRKAQNPEQAEHFWNRTQDFFEDAENEITSNGGVYQDLPIVKKYCEHINVPFEAYKLVLTLEGFKTIQELEKYDIFKEYKNAFEKSAEVVNLQKKTDFKKLSPEQQQEKLNKMLFEYIRKIEQEKLFYFMLAYHNTNKVLIVKSPADSKEQKKFLGYEWSGAKGNEGIKYNNGETVFDIQTPLFNPKDRNDTSKISYWIAQNFETTQTLREFETLQEFQELVTYANLTDLLDFSRKDFNKALSLTPKKKISVDTKWEIVKLGDVAEIVIGGTPSRAESKYFEGSNLWVSIAEMNGQIITDTKEKITDEGVKKSNVKLIPKGTTLLSFKLSIGKTAIAGADLYTNEAIAGLIPKDKKSISDAYLFQLFTAKLIDLSTSNNAIGQSLNSKYLRDELKIPLPPLEIQEKIVSECEAIDQATEKAKKEIEKAKREIEKKVKEVFENSNIQKEKIENLSILLKRGKSTKYGNSNIQVIKSGQARGFKEFDFSEKYFAIEDFIIDERKLQKGDLLINSTGVGTAGRVTLFELEGNFVADSHITIFRPKDSIISKFALYCFAHIGFKNIEQMAKGSTGQIELSLPIIGSIQIPVPPLEVQEKLVAEIEILEKQIAENEAIIKNSASEKQAVLKKYLT